MLLLTSLSDSSSCTYLIQCNGPSVFLLIAPIFLHSANWVTDSCSISFSWLFCSWMLAMPSFLTNINRNKNNPPISLVELRVSGTYQSPWHHWLFCGEQSRYLFSLAINCTLKTNSFVFSFLFLLRPKQNTFMLTTNISQGLGKISKVIKSTVCVVCCCSCTLKEK